MENVLPMNLKSRLLRLGFNEPDVDKVLAQLGAAATIDNAVSLLGIVVLKSALQRAGFVYKGVDAVLGAETWEASEK